MGESESESRSILSDSLQPMDCVVHGILQARILEWVDFPFSRGSSQYRVKPKFPALQADSLPAELQENPRNTGVVSLSLLQYSWGSLVAQLVKNLPAMPETLV